MVLKIKNGWVEGVRRVKTNKMGGDMVPKGIVLHYTAGWTTQGDVATLSTSDRKASVQFVLGRDGELIQIVPCDRVAWHAGPSKYKGFTGLNNSFIGIEICNAGWIKKLSNGNYLDQYSQEIKPDGRFVGMDRTTFSPPGGWHHMYHPRLAKGTYAWEPYYPAQLDKLDELVAALLKAYPTIKHIVTHEEIDTRGWKTDTGPMFDMRRYTKLLEDRSADVAEEVTPEKAPEKAPAKVPEKAPSSYVSNVWLRLRETPNGDIKDDQVEPGMALHLQAKQVDGNWALVYGTDDDGQEVTGWIRAEHLRKDI